MPTREDKSWKPMGSIPSAGKIFFFMKFLLKFSCMIILLSNLCINHKSHVHCINCIMCVCGRRTPKSNKSFEKVDHGPNFLLGPLKWVEEFIPEEYNLLPERIHAAATRHLALLQLPEKFMGWVMAS